ncbi:MAG: 16S rRNA (cytidine(1402)-2'-O)-methyltransferase [gamma proteobacterium symbiont of Bathyaustriella thionipta]|nr:16S rRNA (cytidine(1402)-2'-O)-methyltransferase [gamma proteobacterium symbiont of Bathyaustriella thionipta]MCU7948403.1 16S rRNA (cytidine(1402)-2'-O)-methyltransferase [gamma proteobacterium symbiont of Bathyaustriella thionipta]MCU7954102.1 16S rRNA (cytidine(1402)-2'-O)-methyltransferase [gamma proteobacterium symbiont of Bathyaustriella thionipta]MCU7955395.1 16S rRNA (cytidine(1402)-2'-O)-methyltransferase [gamma proteobacterium symbiont of Bathyaustriella thionipta]MCU7968662.1 16S 
MNTTHHDGVTASVNKRSGQLYIVATPIGNLQDISPRAVAVLKNVDKIAAEDTRHSGRLLKQLDINTHCIALHEHNERQFSEKIIQQIKEGSDIALISDAGTPLVSDPGYFLVKLAHQEKITVTPVPGPSALIAALSAAGLATDKFCFEGFVPSKGGPRKAFYAQRQKEPRTMVFYETPHRIVESLNDLCSELGEQRTVVLARELTKTFETIKNASAKALRDWIIADANQQKGEIVLVVQGFQAPEGETLSELAEHTLRVLLQELSLKQAVKLTADISGEKKKKIYHFALALKNSE